MDIFEKLNRQAVLIKKQSFKALRNRLFLACQQYKTDAQFTAFFNELLCTENYQDVVNAIKLLDVTQVYKDKLNTLLRRFK
ncbi:hypothetical protein QV08_01145 [Gallibacterium salpingitidis]|uniref:Uncharacterized protein n=1 Tax=Gallibacterium salpingitidis TaxID=505341 RepID=A0AB36E2U0_9PAST|nr:hypothetical protein [Gallibacterium salpingitidis]OBX09578.1 hypothetical protein QV08_01145 [Gallibacterium salpingitidis]OBX10434.1 hypothetical protein QV09_05700 [Gallibacterium salpingitidis]